MNFTVDLNIKNTARSTIDTGW